MEVIDTRYLQLEQVQSLETGQIGAIVAGTTHPATERREPSDLDYACKHVLPELLAAATAELAPSGRLVLMVDDVPEGLAWEGILPLTTWPVGLVVVTSDERDLEVPASTASVTVCMSEEARAQHVLQPEFSASNTVPCNTSLSNVLCDAGLPAPTDTSQASLATLLLTSACLDHEPGERFTALQTLASTVGLDQTPEAVTSLYRTLVTGRIDSWLSDANDQDDCIATLLGVVALQGRGLREPELIPLLDGWLGYAFANFMTHDLLWRGADGRVHFRHRRMAAIVANELRNIDAGLRYRGWIVATVAKALSAVLQSPPTPSRRHQAARYVLSIWCVASWLLMFLCLLVGLLSNCMINYQPLKQPGWTSNTLILLQS
jgi:hypothetical protein